MKNTSRPALYFVLTLLMGVSAHAMPMPNKSTGMHHLSVTTDPNAAATPKTDPSFPAPGTNTPAPSAPTATTPARAAPKPLAAKDALKKTDTLTQWPYYTDILTINNDTALDTVLHRVDIDPGSVPPKGLLLIAKALSDRKRYDEAAFYFYAGQLRANFDMARFPPYLPDMKKERGDARTDDQKGKVPDKPIELVNPHESVSVLSLTIGSPISRWAMADPARLASVMARVRDWDLATPYAYLPDYDISHAVSFDQWPALLDKTRADYFARVNQISSGLSRVRAATPSPTFLQPR